MDLGDKDHNFRVDGDGEEMQRTLTRTESDGGGYHGASPSFDGAIRLHPPGNGPANVSIQGTARSQHVKLATSPYPA